MWRVPVTLEHTDQFLPQILRIFVLRRGHSRGHTSRPVQISVKLLLGDRLDHEPDAGGSGVVVLGPVGGA